MSAFGGTALLVLTLVLALAIAPLAPPLLMVLLWTGLVAFSSGGGFLAGPGWDGLGGDLGDAWAMVWSFVLAECPFFLAATAAGSPAPWVAGRVGWNGPMVTLAWFYAAGALLYGVRTALMLPPDMASPSVIWTILRNGLSWWGPFAAVAGIVFWVIAGRRLHHSRRRRFAQGVGRTA